MRNAYNGTSTTQPHAPKPAFLAAKTVQDLLGGKTFLRRLPVVGVEPTNGTFALEFENSHLAVWNTIGETDNSSCAEDKPLRHDCGFLHITKQECEARGCCFALPPVPGTPQCFFHPRDFNATVSFFYPSANAGDGGTPCWMRVGLLGPTPHDEKVCAATNGKVTLTTVSDEPCFLVPV